MHLLAVNVTNTHDGIRITLLVLSSKFLDYIVVVHSIKILYQVTSI